ncbi:MAG: transposase [Chloroflexi bacterium]|nr:transposase [Chloroflexota bacterium]MBU1747454.1 transposase [Chloroflexota bacterium]MBU1879430.1 transposase [Chloroflexota bacterium]
MSIVQREEQILRIKAASFQSALNEALEQRIQERVVATVKAILEAALDEELAAVLVTWPGPKPRRSGSFGCTTDTQYGRITDLRVPKLRWGNKQRPWHILQRYQRALTGLLDWLAYVYVMGLSLRDLQEALYLLLGAMLSPTALNRVTLRLQDHLAALQHAPIVTTPPILIVDGV